MFGTLASMVGIVSVVQSNKYIEIRGVTTYGLMKDITRTWGTSRVFKYLFTGASSRSLRFENFFAIDVLYMMRELYKNPSNSTSRRVLKKIIEELESETWLRDLNLEDQFDRLDFTQLSKQIIWSLRPHQLEFLKKYNRNVSAYRLRGLMLAAAPGTGKTITCLGLGACLKADTQIYIVPKNALERVWEDTIKTAIVGGPDYWISREGRQAPPPGLKYYVFHYEALGEAVSFAKQQQGKLGKVFIAIDESHNFNDLKSQRVQNLIELRNLTQASDVVWSSGTPIKAIGNECIPFLTTIDPLFTDTAEERFRKIYGADAKRANDILRNRIGEVSYRVEKTEVVDIKVITHEVKVQLKNGHEYTLDSLRKEMQLFIEERTAYYQSNMKTFEALYTKCLELHEKTLSVDGAKRDFNVYKQYVQLIRRNYDPQLMKNETMYCNRYELQNIIPSLPQNLKAEFKAVRSVIKYVQLKVFGEALGGILGRRRAECHVAMSQVIPFADIIEGAAKKTLVFTSYVEVVRACNEILTKLGYKPMLVFGETNRQLADIVKRFYSDADANPIVATYPSLSTAVPLIPANTLIMVNSPFRDHERDQTIARAARMGQDQDVHVYDIFLDTGALPNISTRSKDILEWSKAQVQAIMGIEAPDNVESMEAIIHKLDFDAMKEFQASFEGFVDDQASFPTLDPFGQRQFAQNLAQRINDRAEQFAEHLAESQLEGDAQLLSYSMESQGLLDPDLGTRLHDALVVKLKQQFNPQAEAPVPPVVSEREARMADALPPVDPELAAIELKRKELVELHRLEDPVALESSFKAIYGQAMEALWGKVKQLKQDTGEYLYHGSGYDQKELMPGFKRSGQLVKWDFTEDNTWLYACYSRESAIAMGIASQVEKQNGVTRFVWDDVDTVTVETDGGLDRAVLDTLVVYLYTIKLAPEDHWQLVGNQHNGLGDEYKTQRTIDKHIVSVEAIAVKDWFKGKKLIVK